MQNPIKKEITTIKSAILSFAMFIPVCPYNVYIFIFQYNFFSIAPVLVKFTIYVDMMQQWCDLIEKMAVNFKVCDCEDDLDLDK